MHAHTHTHTLSLSLSQTHTHTHSLSLSLSLSHTHTHTKTTTTTTTKTQAHHTNQQHYAITERKQVGLKQALYSDNSYTESQLINSEGYFTMWEVCAEISTYSLSKTKQIMKTAKYRALLCSHVSFQSEKTSITTHAPRYRNTQTGLGVGGLHEGQHNYVNL